MEFIVSDRACNWLFKYKTRMCNRGSIVACRGTENVMRHKTKCSTGIGKDKATHELLQNINVTRRKNVLQHTLCIR